MSTTDPGAEQTKRRRMAPDERRAHLLDAAAEVLVEDGLDALTMEAVAQRAGVSKSLGWAYFENVGELLRELFDRELKEVYERIDAAIAGADDFDAKVEAAVGAYFDVVDERGAVLAAVQWAVQATSHGEAPRQTRTDAFIVSLGKLIRTRYRASLPVAMAQGVVVGGIVNSWGQIYGAAGGAVRRPDAEGACVRWIIGGLDATLPRR